MDKLRKVTVLSAAALLLATAGAQGQTTAVPTADIQSQLTQMYQTAKATADGTDLVSAGSVLVLQKDHLVMSRVDQALPTPNIYKNGTISSGVASAAKFFNALNKLGSLNPLGANAAAQSAAAGADTMREFVAGEKFFVTKIDTKADGVTLSLLSDPIKDNRYRATLKFPFAKGTAPTPDDVTAMVADVVKIDEPPQQEQQQAPEPVQTKTISIGQTRDQVIAMLGVPSKVVQLGKKEIDIFPDMKITFVQSKVVDVQ